jgi:hypothetical protein
MVRDDKVVDIRDTAEDEQTAREVMTFPDPGRGWVLRAREPLDGSFLDPDLLPLAASLDALDDALGGNAAPRDLQGQPVDAGVTNAAQQVLRYGTQLIHDLDARRWR